MGEWDSAPAIRTGISNRPTRWGLQEGRFSRATFFPARKCDAFNRSRAQHRVQRARLGVHGFPDLRKPCSTSNPLHTDEADLVLQQPYQAIDPTATPPSYNGTLSGGLFTAVVNGPNI